MPRLMRQTRLERAFCAAFSVKFSVKFSVAHTVVLRSMGSENVAVVLRSTETGGTECFEGDGS